MFGILVRKQGKQGFSLSKVIITEHLEVAIFIALRYSIRSVPRRSAFLSRLLLFLDNIMAAALDHGSLVLIRKVLIFETSLVFGLVDTSCFGSQGTRCNEVYAHTVSIYSKIGQHMKCIDALVPGCSSNVTRGSLCLDMRLALEYSSNLVY
ncbi:hypothetical protein Tco_0588297 [Tanacetum coccineum]